MKTMIWNEYHIKQIDQIYAGLLKSNARELVVTSLDTMLATQLPMIHRDPFDRLLIAQSHNNQCHLITVDGKIAQYEMPYIVAV